MLIEPKDVPDDEIVPPLKKIIRRATPADISREDSNRQKEKNAYSICQQKIHAHNLPMKLIDSEYCFDGSQITFYFSAEARVDFRELVKDLAGMLRTKVQLHQVGVRDEAKLFGGMGLRTPDVLRELPERLRARLHENGKGAESLPESPEVFRGYAGS